MNEAKIIETLQSLQSLAGNIDPEIVGYLADVIQSVARDAPFGSAAEARSNLELRQHIIKAILKRVELPEDVARSLNEFATVPQNYRRHFAAAPRLFLSYAHADDMDFVERLWRDLTKEGYIVWWDRAELPSRGISLLQELRDAIIDEVDRVIPIAGPAALASPSVQYEWNYARLSCKIITPILRLGRHSDLPDDFKRIPYANFCEDEDEYDYEQALGELLKLLEAPVKPLGALLGVPTFPPHYMSRHSSLEILAEHVLADVARPVVITSAQQTTALHGMGGVGKCELAPV